jgi:hypothetical protein
MTLPRTMTAEYMPRWRLVAWVTVLTLTTALSVLGDGVAGGVAATPTSETQISVIGAGFGRTGTESLRLALTQLGHRTYHSESVDAVHCAVVHHSTSEHSTLP